MTTKIALIFSTAAVMIVAIVVTGLVLGEPTLLIPNESRVIRAELAATTAQEETRKAEDRLNGYLYRRSNPNQ